MITALLLQATHCEHSFRENYSDVRNRLTERFSSLKATFQRNTNCLKQQVQNAQENTAPLATNLFSNVAKGTLLAATVCGAYYMLSGDDSDSQDTRMIHYNSHTALALLGGILSKHTFMTALTLMLPGVQGTSCLLNIEDQSVEAGDRYSLRIDLDNNPILRNEKDYLIVRLRGGNPLPSWLSFTKNVANEKFAYMPQGDRGLRIYDLTNYRNPNFISEYKFTTKIIKDRSPWDQTDDDYAGALDIAVINNIAYIAYGTNGLHVVDVTNPANPKFLGNYTRNEPVEDYVLGHARIPYNIAFSIAVQEQIGYIAYDTLGLCIVDLKNPKDISLLSQYPILDKVTTFSDMQIKVEGNYAYIKTYGKSAVVVFIINIANPKKPFLSGIYDPKDPIHNALIKDIAIKNNKLYIASWSGFLIVDVSDATKPVLLNNLTRDDGEADFYTVTVSDSQILVHNPNDGSRGGTYYLDNTNAKPKLQAFKMFNNCQNPISMAVLNDTQVSLQMWGNKFCVGTFPLNSMWDGSSFLGQWQGSTQDYYAMKGAISFQKGGPKGILQGLAPNLYPQFNNIEIVGKSCVDTFKLIVTQPTNSIEVNPIVNAPDAVVGENYKFAVNMKNSFNDKKSRPLTYRAQLSDGKALPQWLKFTQNVKIPHVYEFSGKPGHGDMNFYSEKIEKIKVIAENNKVDLDTNMLFSQQTTFDLKVTGQSTGKLLVAIGSPIVSALGTAFTLYHKRAAILNYLNKKKYQKPKVEITLDDPNLEKTLETPLKRVGIVQAFEKAHKEPACYQVWKSGIVPLKGGALLPIWLQYNPKTNVLSTKDNGPNQHDLGELIIRIMNDSGIIQEEFPIEVMLAKTSNESSTSAGGAMDQFATPLLTSTVGDDANL